MILKTVCKNVETRQQGSSDEASDSCFEGVQFEFLRDDDFPNLGLPKSPKIL
jgi:hypothetical protein